MMNLIPLYFCQFCKSRIMKPEVTHDGQHTHASCLFAYIFARSFVRRIQRESRIAHRAVSKLLEQS